MQLLIGRLVGVVPEVCLRSGFRVIRLALCTPTNWISRITTFKKLKRP